MKFRKFLVSNSSSSSFILLLKRKPESVGDVLKLLYPVENPEKFHIHCEYYDDTVLHAPEAAKLIYEQLMQHEKSWGLKEKKGGYTHPTKIETIGRFINSDYYYVNRNEMFKRSRTFENYIDEDDRHSLVELSLEKQDKYEKNLHLFIKYRDQHEKELKKDKPKDYQIDWNELHRLIATHPDYNDTKKEEEASRAKFESLCKKIGEKIYNKWIKEGYWIGVVNFGDEDGEIGAVMEHGNAFSKIKHIRVNQH